MEFKNIRRQAQKEAKARTAKTIANIRKGEALQYYKSKLTARQAEKTEAEQMAIIIAKLQKELQKELKKIDEDITRIEQAPDLLGLTLSVEWKPSKIWGSNPNCTARIHTANGWEYYESGSIGGCGYDKESTATARVLNNCPSVKKALYTAYEKALKKNKAATLREVLGYGSGYGSMPYFEGGVGVNCHQFIFEDMGYIFKRAGWGKSYACYEVEKGKKK